MEWPLLAVSFLYWFLSVKDCPRSPQKNLIRWSAIDWPVCMQKAFLHPFPRHKVSLEKIMLVQI